MSTLVRAAAVTCALGLGACDNLIGIKDIVPEHAPVELVFESVASTGVVRQPLGVFTVKVRDVQGGTVADYRGDIKLSLASNPAGANLIGAPTVTAISGAARFDAVGLDQVASGYTLVASADGLPPATSVPFDVVGPPFVPVPTGLVGGDITGIGISPAAPGGSSVVFAAAGNGVYRSDNAGASWQPASFGASSGARVLADPQHPGVVYLAPAPNTGRQVPLKKTVDGGASWRDVGLGDTAGSVLVVEGFEIDPKDPAVLYAVNERSFYRSSNGGESWSMSAGFPSGCNQLAVDQVTTSDMYCVAFSSGMLRSRDGGATWSPFVVNDFDVTKAYRVFASPGGLFVFVNDGKVYRSIDAGASWTSVADRFPSAIAYAPSMPRRMYLVDGSTLEVSDDGGASFGPAMPVNDFVHDLAVDPANPDVLYAAGFRGVSISIDGGATWSLSTQGIDAPRIDAVKVAPGSPDVALITTGGGVLRTTSGGASWSTVVQELLTIQFDPVVSTRVYFCGGQRFGTSIDGGASVTMATTPTLPGCQRLLFADTGLYAVGASQLLMSADQGMTWNATGPTGIIDVALLDPAGNGLVAVLSDGLSRSTDGGATFTQIVGGISVIGILSDPAAPDHLIAAGCGFHESTNGGLNFPAKVIPDKFVGLCVSALDSAGSRFYAAGQVFGGLSQVLTSGDGGSSWSNVDIGGGIPRGLFITSIAGSKDGKTIYVGTQGGLYKSTGR